MNVQTSLGHNFLCTPRSHVDESYIVVCLPIREPADSHSGCASSQSQQSV